MRNLLLLLLALGTLFTACSEQSEKTETTTPVEYPKGKLFIIGGGDRGDSLMMDLIVASGWKPGDLITTITLPSGWGDSAYIWLNNDFKKLTGQNCVKFDSAAVHVPEKLDSLRKSKIIFISGGDQAVMMRLIKGTAIKEAINEAYQNGALIGGTSAGASIQSERMITGEGLVDTVYESTFDNIWKGNLELVEGLGLLDSVIIDQHFVARSRYNRLLCAVIENKGFQCIGIDEGTAILVSQGMAEVVGVSQVIEVAAPISVDMSRDTLLTAKQIHINIYAPGDKFPIKQ
jgi:cyanophycinase